MLYPAELLRHLKVLCNFQGSKESNNLPLRRRTLYPTEVRERIFIQMAGESSSFRLGGAYYIGSVFIVWPYEARFRANQKETTHL